LNPNADPDGYLYGHVVVFTGTLMSMNRRIAWGECARVGAIAEHDTTKRTNVLVIGDINPAVLRPGSTLTGKARKAFELQDKGQDIEVMTEDDFLRCLDGKRRHSGHQVPTVTVNLKGKTYPVRCSKPPSRTG
jgi:NAD-dependent DNA ligase